MKSRIHWLLLLLAIVMFGGLAWVIYIIRTEVTQFGDLIGLGVVGAICLIFGVFLTILAFFEERIMKAMHGDFSNRNPWGR